ncbi:hypothetical protein B0H17DRAFT_1138516 [Mycena rosella]|uniref:Uncharacterized protein n=1 Tax=Mycena rosella TaxID=1033263 RepID=A0AAD7G9K5_MYCRO|nr:hypothetical protein B0H17DRAFT_1138516 [Mycena rosella]
MFYVKQSSDGFGWCHIGGLQQRAKPDVLFCGCQVQGVSTQWVGLLTVPYTETTVILTAESATNRTVTRTVINISEAPTARRASRRRLTIMSVLMESGFKLARRREMVSLPPEKMRSIATAEPIQSTVNTQKPEGKMCTDHSWSEYHAQAKTNSGIERGAQTTTQLDHIGRNSRGGACNTGNWRNYVAKARNASGIFKYIFCLGEKYKYFACCVRRYSRHSRPRVQYPEARGFRKNSGCIGDVGRPYMPYRRRLRPSFLTVVTGDGTAETVPSSRKSRGPTGRDGGRITPTVQPSNTVSASSPIDGNPKENDTSSSLSKACSRYFIRFFFYRGRDQDRWKTGRLGRWRGVTESDGRNA